MFLIVFKKEQQQKNHCVYKVDRMEVINQIFGSPPNAFQELPSSPGSSTLDKRCWLAGVDVTPIQIQPANQWLRQLFFARIIMANDPFENNVTYAHPQ